MGLAKLVGLLGDLPPSSRCKSSAIVDRFKKNCDFSKKVVKIEKNKDIFL